jgi:hypothetical protein
MSSSELNFKIWLKDNLPRLVSDYRHFDGNIITMADEHKDEICYNFLLNFESWWDDILPACVRHRASFVRSLYEETEDEDMSLILRGDIYLSLESHLADFVDEAYCETFNIKPEPFAGYERGQ